MYNELFFISQLIIFTIFLKKFIQEKYTILLSQTQVILYILMNMFAHYEVCIFGIYSSIIEPLGAAHYFISIYLWNFDKKLFSETLKNIILISGLITTIFGLMFFYKSTESILLFKHFIYNNIISLSVIQVTYRIEQLIFNRLNKITLFWRSQISLLVSQLYDTLFYSMLIFYSKSLLIKVQIALFAYVIKLFCILFYSISQFYSLKKSNQSSLTKND